MKPETFLITHSLFTREEFAAVLRERGRTRATVDSHLARWLRNGRIERVKRGVFVRCADSDGQLEHAPDFIALASRMAPDGAVAFHTALEAHGFAQSVFENLTFVTWTKCKPSVFRGRRFIPVRPRAPLSAADDGEHWMEHAERAGVEFRTTTLERTLVDVLDRPALAGGVEEVWRSLLSVTAIDPAAIEEYVTLLGNKTLAAKVGFFLESRREQLVVPDGMLERLRGRIPRSPVYMDRTRKGRLVSDWALIVPVELHPSLQEFSE